MAMKPVRSFETENIDQFLQLYLREKKTRTYFNSYLIKPLLKIHTDPQALITCLQSWPAFVAIWVCSNLPCDHHHITITIIIYIPMAFQNLIRSVHNFYKKRMLPEWKQRTRKLRWFFFSFFFNMLERARSLKSEQKKGWNLGPAL